MAPQRGYPTLGCEVDYAFLCFRDELALPASLSAALHLALCYLVVPAILIAALGPVFV